MNFGVSEKRINKTFRADWDGMKFLYVRSLSAGMSPTTEHVSKRVWQLNRFLAT
ncbi:unnamed protein product [marine sediment metagenome]|uniref:Uncharacterized protein n=1 Tax=marine sediment metagenome TaxID=412755 RepID=X0YSV7_9ZZZZ